MNTNKTEYMSLKQKGVNYTLISRPLKLVDQFTFSAAVSHLYWNKMGFLPSSSPVNTTVWMYHIDTNKMHGEKARWELQKKATCCFELIQEATPHKTAVALPLTSYHKNHPSKTKKTSRTLLKKQGQTHKWCSLMSSCIWMRQC